MPIAGRERLRLGVLRQGCVPRPPRFRFWGDAHIARVVCATEAHDLTEAHDPTRCVQEIKKILQGLSGLKVVGADIVEVAPGKPCSLSTRCRSVVLGTLSNSLIAPLP
ncbi:hypothetical protein BD309DRAFT_954644 [Dichomitus squalens]|nr:hypothetical protein BD309DRAFT_954644 [Dichomitus squalens]